MTLQHVDIAGPVGSLEGLLNVPDGDVRQAAVVCHPHPVHGGTMHNNVVYNTARAMRERGMAVLRFNFRGVGKSAGTYDCGRGEQDDVRAAIDWTLARYPQAHCVLAGFSFGSWVGLRVGAEDDRIRGLLGVGMPVDSSDFSYLKTSARPLAVVQGGGDEFGSEKALRLLIDSLDCPTHVEVVPDAGHFFPRRFGELRAAVTRALDFLLGEDTPVGSTLLAHEDGA